MPAFFTVDLQARIPDELMPVQAVQELNAQSPDGRRPTLQNMGVLRRMSYAGPTDGASHPKGAGFTTGSASSMLLRSDPTQPTASAAIMRRPSAATTSVARPCNIEVGPP